MELGTLITILLVLALWLLPAFIAFRRNHHNAPAILATSVLLGWSGLGWIAAFIWSLTATEGNHA